RHQKIWSCECLTGVSFCGVIFRNIIYVCFFFFSSRRRHTRCLSDWSSDVCSSDLTSARRGTCSQFQTSNIEDIESNLVAFVNLRSEERRVGKECRSRWSTDY